MEQRSLRSAGRRLAWPAARIPFAFPLALTLALLFAPTPARASRPGTIRIGIASAGVGSPPIVVGTAATKVQVDGWLEREFAPDGIEVKWIFHKGAGPAVNEALAGGQLDFAFQGDLPSLLGRAQGVETRLLLPLGSGAHMFVSVPARSPVKGVAELRGRRVAIFKGTNLQLAAQKILAAHGLTERDVRVVNLDFAAAQAALVAGDVDAVFGTIEQLVLRDQGSARIIYDTRRAPFSFTRQAHLLVTERFAAAEPDLVARVVRVFVRAARWASDEANRQALYTLWSRAPYTPAVWAEEYAGSSLAARQSPVFDAALARRYQEAADEAVRFRLLRRPVDVSGWIDASFVRAALRQERLEAFWPEPDRGGRPAKADGS